METNFKSIADDFKERYYNGDVEPLSDRYPVPKDNDIYLFIYNGIELPDGEHMTARPKPGWEWTYTDLLGVLEDSGISQEKRMTREYFVLSDEEVLFYVKAEDDGLTALAAIPKDLSVRILTEFLLAHPDVYEKSKKYLEQ